MNATHDPALRSWVESAHDSTTDFPIQNLPLGIIRRAGTSERWRIGVAIGAHVVDLAAAVDVAALGADPELRALVAAAETLNSVMRQGEATARALRAWVSRLLRHDTPQGEVARRNRDTLLLADTDVEHRLPMEVGDYTDFYASIHHATNVGSMFRPDNPLLPNYKWVPIGYHGRASSVVVSGTPIQRPWGQTAPEGDAAPAFTPSRRLDYEAEVGFVIGRGNRLGDAIPVNRAAEHLFGMVLVNDWSARDVQAWEYQPLGPFLAKNFATTVSPWVVLREALEPFRVRPAARPAGDPEPLPYLRDDEDAARGAYALQIEVWLRSAAMRAAGAPAMRLSRGSLANMYWTPAQLIAHHASNGCNLTPGDLLASGTVSGPTREERGCLLELTWRGTEPLTLPTGEVRRFLEDGDEVILRGSCEADGTVRIGFGECAGLVQSAAPRG